MFGRKFLLKIAAAAAASITMLATVPATAHAETLSQDAWYGKISTSCPGSFLKSYPLKNANGVSGPFRLDVFYSSTNGGTNCAKLYNNSGVKTYMTVKVEVPSNGHYAYDVGNYISYAGAAQAFGTANRCINVWSGAMYKGVYYYKDIVGGFCS